MAVTGLPAPVVRPLRPEDLASLDVRRLRGDLEARVDGEVRFDAGSRGAYATDASNFRQVPIGVVVPRSVEAVVETVAICREHGAPLLSRGGGTSLAGQTCNTAVVVDWSKYLHRILAIDAEQRIATVQPGTVLDDLRDAAVSGFGLTFGPDPSTHAHCTLGGMIGNNSCGMHAQMAGKTADNTEWLDLLLYDGTRMRVSATSDADYERIVADGGRPAEVYRALRALRDRYADAIRARFPRIPRRVSGYGLEHLLPENGFHVARALVGSEGTLVTVLEAGLRLIPNPPHRVLVVLPFPDIVTAGRAVPGALETDPIALEGMDGRLLRFSAERHVHTGALGVMPRGGAWLIAEYGGESPDEARARAQSLMEAAGRLPAAPRPTLVDDPAQQRLFWKVREAGLGTTSRTYEYGSAWPGWEDSAVRPDDLGDYLHDLQRLFGEFGYEASVYGHFGQACVHCRIPFDLVTADGIRDYRSFLERAADLVVRYGGSLSGEHGDGQQRAELLPRMYGDELVRAFGELKAIFDPDNRMNPGKVVAPYRLDENLRLGTGYDHRTSRTHFGYPDDRSSFAFAVQRCVGVGQCRREHPTGGVMCPSYQVTREEEHSTRGRARLLWEMLEGDVVADGWRSDAVHDALDLCLMCKGCKSDCPAHVDMATYKAEFLAHHYAGRLRPRAHYSMGWLPVWARLAARAPGLANRLGSAPGLARVAKAAAGVDQQRALPRFASQTLQEWYRDRGPRGSGARGEVVLWPDTFTNSFAPQIGHAAVELLESAGWRVLLPQHAVCCGLTWISTGQLRVAKSVLRRTLNLLRPLLRDGTHVVGLEPSCTSVLRSDAVELFPNDPDVHRLQESTLTLAELLTRHAPGWEPPHLDGEVLVQRHCHQHAVLGFDADEALLRATGADVQVLDSGCCGLAGNFGFEAGHYDVSRAIGERALLPAVRNAEPGTAVLADGFSCRTQIEQGDTGRRARHLAELLRSGLDGQP